MAFQIHNRFPGFILVLPILFSTSSSISEIRSWYCLICVLLGSPDLDKNEFFPILRVFFEERSMASTRSFIPSCNRYDRRLYLRSCHQVHIPASTPDRIRKSALRGGAFRIPVDTYGKRPNQRPFRILLR
jgi:hypothetical protein